MPRPRCHASRSDTYAGLVRSGHIRVVPNRRVAVLGADGAATLDDGQT